MKKGITITQRFELENITSIDEVSEAIFSYSDTKKEKTNDEDFLLIKKMSKNEVSFADGKFIIPLSQADTNELTKVYYIEAQLIFNSGATNKWNISTRSLSDTLRTEDVSGESDGTETEDITMSTDEIFHYTDTYTKDEVDDKDTETLNTAKGYTDEVAEDLDQAKEDKFAVEGHLSKEDGTLTSDSCKVYKYKYTFNKSAYPGIKEGDLIYNYTNINALFRSDLYYIEDVSGSVLQYREINGDAVRVIKSVDDPPTESGSGYNPGDIWQKYSSPTFNIGTLTDVFLCVAQNGGIIPATVKWVRLVEDSYSKDEMDDILLDFGNGISCSIDPLTYVCTFQLKNGDSVVSSASIDLPLETMVLDVDYDSQTKELVITLKNGTVRRVDVSAIVSGLVTVSDFEDAISDIEDALDEKEDKINASHKINADFLDDSSSSKKLVPSSSSSDSGKFLRVGASGSPEWQLVANAEDNSY